MCSENANSIVTNPRIVPRIWPFFLAQWRYDLQDPSFSAITYYAKQSNSRDPVLCNGNVRKMDGIRVMSFDLDGTITDISFVDSVWLEGMPRLYALKNDVSFEDAKRYVMTEYNKVGRERLEWYDLGYWIEKLGLDVSPKEVLSSFQNRIKMFPEVLEVLKDFRDRGLRLIVVTNARREFVDLELERTKIKHYFERVFSSTSDFGLIKKTVGLYLKVCSICDISPEEMIHVGDDQFFDFNVPKKLGIIAFYLDRTGEQSGESVIHTLKELSGKFVEQTLQKEYKRS